MTLLAPALSKILTKISFKHIVFLYLLMALIATIQCYFGSIYPTGYTGRSYPNYNNYLIFKNSYFHLIHGKDLYIAYPKEQWDLYKYSPTFSLVFAVFAYLPDFIGLLFWNLLNTIPLLIGFCQLGKMSVLNKVWALLFCLIELSGNLQNAQSNGLMAALLILTFTSLENRKYFLATFFVVFSVYLKIYGGIGFILFLFYPSKMQLLLFTLLWFLFLGTLPLLVTDLYHLFYQYKDWIMLLRADRENSTGISVMGILHSWFGLTISKNAITGIGLLLFLLPLIQVRKYIFYDFRIWFLCSTLIWVVIFNHKAESPTYIIAICGIAIWFFSQPANIMNITLIILTFIFTTLSTGDLFPYYIKEEFIKPYFVKALFSTLIFGKITFELFTRKMEP